MATKKLGKQSVFLAAFSNCGQVKRAAIMAEIDRTSHYYWMDHDQAYPALFAKATLKAIQVLVDEAVERATTAARSKRNTIAAVLGPTTYQARFRVPGDW